MFIYVTDTRSSGKWSGGPNVESIIFATALILRGAHNYDDQVPFVVDNVRQLGGD